MTRAETATILGIIVTAYPGSKVQADERTLSLWAEMLADLPAELVTNATKAMIATLKFPPTIADIRAAVVKLTSDARGDLTAGEAWDKIMRAVRRYGWNRPDEAKAALGDALWGAVGTVGGWATICACDEPQVLSAQFERRYEALRKQEQYRLQVPENVQRHTKALVEGLTKRLTGGAGDR